MKHFKITNDNYKNWKEKTFKHASDVAYYIKSNNLSSFTIYWKSPLYGTYGEIMTCDCGVMTVDPNLNIPKTLLNLKIKPRLFTANRESGYIIDEVKSVKEGLKLIKKYEKEDKKEGTFEANFYDIINEDGTSVDITGGF